jgi:chemotaxis protein methyltransferase CheR
MLTTTLEFEQLRDAVHRRCGIYVDESRRKTIEDHIRRRMDILGVARFVDYFRFLALGTSSEELRLLLNIITVNETYFFRDYTQLTTFGEQVLPELLTRKDRQGSRRLRLLCAGCSSGEEPYTLAIMLRELIEDIDEWDVRIDAFDLNTEVLDAARLGVYGARSTRDVPISYRGQHFENVNDGLRVIDPVRELVQIEYGNMHDVSYMAHFANLDLVFCRNVFIYFDNSVRRRVLSTFYDLMQPGGYIFLGYAESVSRFSAAFEMRRLGDTICFRKPLGSRTTLSTSSGVP